MKIRNWITLGLLLSTSALSVACGGKDDDKDNPNDTSTGDGDGDGNGDGGAGNSGQIDTSQLEKEIEALKKIIADLKDQVDSASAQEIPDLQDDLDAANERLDALETCQNGGKCDGVSTALALTAYSDAYCDWVFGCCSDDEARATLGQAASDVDGCKKMFSQLLLRGGSVPTAPQMSLMDSYSFGQLAARVQTGRIALDAEAVKACAKAQSEATCADAEPSAPATCGEAAESPCDQMYHGMQKEGEPCGYPDDCMEGLVCAGGYSGYKDGVCLPEAEVDDFCQDEQDCASTKGALYCDEESGTCQERASEGDDCAFADSTFDSVSPDTLNVPCMPGYWCSPASFTCLAECDTLDEGDVCTSDDQCGDAKYCDIGALPDQRYAGQCAKKLSRGAASLVAAECKSGAIFSDTTDPNYQAAYCTLYGGAYCAYVCSGMGGEACSYDDFSGGDCNSGSCNEATNKCRAKCEANYDCADGQSCNAGVCYEAVSKNSSCVVTDQCPSTQYCDADTEKCADRVKTGDLEDSSDDCTSDEKCASGSACVAGECRPYTGLGSGEYCTDWYHCSSGRCELAAEEVADNNTCKAASDLGDEGDDCDMADLDPADINQDPCKKGLFCKRSAPNSSDDYSGTCTKQLEPGSSCDRSLSASTPQCVGNLTCVTNPATGALACRVPYSEPGQQDKCVLGPSTFATSVAYGDFSLPL